LPPGREAAAQYIDGLEALETGEYDRAVGAFTRAIQGNEESHEYHRARGVANVLAEQFEAAIADLHRGLKLRPGDRETRLWLAAAYRMSGDPAKGAQHFTHGDEVPVSYASLVYNDMAMEYWSSLRGAVYDRQSRKRVAVKEPVKRLFPDVARAYASRHKGGGQMPSETLQTRMQASLDRGDWQAAMKDITALRLHAPDDAVLRGCLARCLLGLGNAWHARGEFTRALSIQPLWAEGYLGRAEAAAVLGDKLRANADLKTAASLGAKTDGATARISELLSAQSVPENAVTEFAKLLDSEPAFDRIVTSALDLHRAVNAQRARYDEAYQDRIWAWTDLGRAQSKNPDHQEALGRLLYNLHVVPRIWNGPRGGGEQLRPQSDAERRRELDRAMETCDTALKLNPRHVNAIATKGWVLYRTGRSPEAERLADTGLGIERKNVRLLNLKAQVLTDTAGALAAQAAVLRQGRTEITREERSDGVYEVRKHYPPTAEQLAEAARLDAEAAACRRAAAKLTQEREQIHAETIPALLKQSDDALRKTDNRSAMRLVQQAYSYDPDLVEVQRRLAELYRREGHLKAHRAYALQAEPLRHTSAAEALQQAWDHVTRTAWQSATDSLDRAASLDPADARTAAYRSVEAANRSDPAAAERFRRASLALEEARARLMGSSLMASNALPVDLQETGLSWIVRLEQGNALLKAEQIEKALQAFVGNLNLERRFTKEQLIEPIPSAMLPDPTLERAEIPDAPTLASLVSWSRIGAARAYLALGQNPEAEAEFRTIRAYLANWPSTAKGRETMNVVEAWARLGEAQAAYAAKDYEVAFRLLMGGEGWAWQLPPDLDKHRRELSQKVADARKGQWQTANRDRENLPRTNSKARALELELRGLRVRRDSLQENLNRPGSPVSRQRIFQQQLAAVEQQISEKEAALKALEQ
jgi:Flp pilus assembly protein TadD